MKLNEIIKNANFSVEEEKAPVAAPIVEEAPKKAPKKPKTEELVEETVITEDAE